VFAIEYFQRAGVANIEAATTIAEYQRALLKLGFAQNGQSVPMFYCGPKTKSVAEAVTARSWLLAKGDTDWDQYPLIRTPRRPTSSLQRAAVAMGHD
jgi:hypothetical protein